MACIRFRKDTGKWGVDYKDLDGKRRWISCENHEEAKLLLAERIRYPGGKTTFAEVGARWLELSRAKCKPGSIEHYESNLRNHILPAFGDRPISEIKRGEIRDFLVAKMNDGLAGKTTSHLLASMVAVLDVALEDELIQANPAMRLSRRLGLRRAAGSQDIKPFTESELARLLETARIVRPPKVSNQTAAAEYDYELIFTLSSTGLRINEGLALQRPDLDFAGRHVHVERTFTGAGEIGTPKTESSRRSVDMSQGLRDVLQELQRKQLEQKMRLGWTELPIWVFFGPEGRPMRDKSVQRRFKKLLAAADLPTYHSPHDLRHTFASLHVKNGASVAYIRDQLGHRSVQTTLDLYGNWFRLSDHEAADRLDQAISEAREPTVVWDGTSPLIHGRVVEFPR